VQAILETAVDGIVSIDAAGTILSVNRATERIFGYSPEELLGHNVTILMPSPYREEHDRYLSAYLSTGQRKIIGIGREVMGRRKDGTYFPLDLSVGEAVVDGQFIFTGILRDITLRKAAEQRLLEQAELIDLSPDAIVVRDSHDRIRFWSRGAGQLYGYTADEALGRSLPELILPASQRVEFDTACAELTARGNWRGTLRQRTKQGRELDVESRWILLTNSAGASQRLSIDTDVTEKKRLEARLLRAQRLDSIGRLVSGIAHDLNNVLTPILVAADLLEINRPGTDSKSLIQTIHASAQRGSTMIKQLLSFVGGGEGQRIPLSIVALLRELREMLAHTLPKSIELRINLADNCGEILGDPTQLIQVLVNLCVNARDAMPEGGTLTIEAQEFLVTDEYREMFPDCQVGPHVLLSVTDTGAGMSPRVIEQIFDPFFTTKAHGSGTGLGLSVSLGIVRSHGGFINVYSEVGNGTRFMVYLPQTVAKSPLSADLQVPAYPSGAGEWILVVDDEPSILQTTKSSLEVFGYHVLTAGNGQIALELAQREGTRIAAIVLDMMMPGIDGPTTLMALREQLPQTPVLAVSGLQTTARASEIIRAGAHAFLRKPFSTLQLLSKIHEMIATSGTNSRERREPSHE
jgi:PAS domain S-box-containing protein